jgi:hypothetical protein
MPDLDLTPPEHDPIDVLTSTLPVVQSARHVRIEPDRIAPVAEQIAEAATIAPAWDDGLYVRDGTWKTAGWVLALDALNFCFWSEDPDPEERWRVEYEGRLYDGYWALVAALRRAVEEGRPLWDPFYLAEFTARDVAHILRPHDLNYPEIPLLPLRVQNLRELGSGLIAAFPDRNPVTELIASSGRSAAKLVERVTTLFPSFNDVAEYAREPVRFHKRAQILVADLHGAFDGAGLGAFDDLDRLTAFADYKVPQVLRRFGAIAYAEALAARIDNRQLIPAGSPEEVEIRAATVWACELLRRSLADRGGKLRAFEIDWALWLAGQSLPPDTHPYHRTFTVFY